MERKRLNTCNPHRRNFCHLDGCNFFVGKRAHHLQLYILHPIFPMVPMAAKKIPFQSNSWPCCRFEIELIELTLKRSGPTGGLAYGILVNALIGRPLSDRRNFPINLLPFDKVTRSSSDVNVKTKVEMHTSESKIASAREHISNDYYDSD